VFRKLLAAFGAGVEVDTVLRNPQVRPGETLHGEVRFRGGSSDHRVDAITIDFTAVVEVEYGDNETRRTFSFLRSQVSGPFELKSGQTHALPFAIPVHEIVMDIPWLPAHPTFDPGTPYTLPGGNPPIDQVKTGDGQWGPFVEHAGVHCYVGFHGSVGCTAGGRGWSMWSGRISA